MRLTDLIETFKGHDKVIFKLTGIGEMEYSTVEFKDAIDTIEALQQENNDWQERYYELDAGHNRLFNDFCKLQQENEQLRAQVARMKEALELCSWYGSEGLCIDEKLARKIMKALRPDSGTDYHNPVVGGK